MATVVKTKDLTKSYGEFNVVDTLDLAVPEGSVYGFLGRNGAGKTTTMRMLLGLTQPTAGDMEIFGQPFNRKTALPHIGSLIEQPSYYGHLSGRANLDLVARIKKTNRADVDNIINVVGLKESQDRKAKAYSLGMRQRLGLAMALVGRPRLLILDEPTNGLDPAGMHEMRDLICSLPSMFNTTVMVSSHILSEVEQMADTVGIINQGKLVYQGSLAGLNAEAHLGLRVNNCALAQQVLANEYGLRTRVDDQGRILLPVLEDEQVAVLIRRLVNEPGIELCRAELLQESLEAVFLRLTTDGIR
ncbi:MAG: ABC transporter ATP-binding protein [Corynebacterium sp.]|nr:ABC transporter ATP-binding protein [Corynebacterium sp.]